MTAPASIPRLLAATSPSAATDRGVVYQFLVDAGVNRNTAHTVQVWAIGPIKVAFIVAVALVLSRLERRLSRRMVTAMQVASPLRRRTVRSAERAQTIAGVVSAVLRGTIWVLAFLAILSQLGIRLVPFVAGATVIGAALGFGAQTLVKDFLSGLLILAEDQYGVGDSIMVGSTSGTVEGVTLRVTRIRAVDGVVWYVPNGDIRTVGNTSDSDNVALVEVVVPLGTDLRAAGRAAEDEARLLVHDAHWAPYISGEPTFSGATALSTDGVTLRVMVRTAAGEHLQVARELRLRILERLRREGLAWAPDPPAAAAAPSNGGGGGATTDATP